MSKGSNRGTSQVTQYSLPPDLLENQQAVFQAARDFNPQVFTGDRFAPINPFEQQQVQQLGVFGGDLSGVNQLQNTVGGILTGDIGSPNLLRQELDRDLSSEYLNRVINDRLADTTNQITSQYAQAGRLGSDAFGTALGRGIGTSVAPILAQNEQQEAARRQQLLESIINAERGQASTQLSAAQLVPTSQQLELQRTAALGTAGDIQRTMDERSIQAQQQLLAEQNAAEAQRLNALVAASGAGNLGIGSTTTTTGGGSNAGELLTGAGLLARALLV